MQFRNIITSAILHQQYIHTFCIIIYIKNNYEFKNNLTLRQQISQTPEE